MSPIREILVPIDFSDCAVMVVRVAAQLATQVDAKLTLLHAVDLPAGLSDDAVIHPRGGEAIPIRDYLRLGAESKMPAFVEAAAAEGASASGRIVEGRPAPAILSAAGSIPADMIVMGSHGRTGLHRLMLGSVSESVLRQAHCPVTVIRSVHRPECDAPSCQSCRSGVTEQMLEAEAELNG